MCCARQEKGFEARQDQALFVISIYSLCDMAAPIQVSPLQTPHLWSGKNNHLYQIHIE